MENTNPPKPPPTPAPFEKFCFHFKTQSIVSGLSASLFLTRENSF